MLKRICATSALLLGLCFAPALSQASELDSTTTGLTAQVSRAKYTVTGMIQRTGEEGGCYYLDLDGTRYQLVGSESDLDKVLRAGQQVTLIVYQDPAAITACNEGPALRIMEVTKIVKPNRDQKNYVPRERGDVAV